MLKLALAVNVISRQCLMVGVDCIVGFRPRVLIIGTSKVGAAPMIRHIRFSQYAEI